jgi:hypothetical protein
MACLQICKVKISSTALTVSAMMLKNLDLADASSDIQQKLAYNIRYHLLTNKEDLFLSYGGNMVYSVAGFYLTLSRTIYFSMINTFFPSFLIVMTSSVRNVNAVTEFYMS